MARSRDGLLILALVVGIACGTTGIRNFSRIDDSSGHAGAMVGFGGATPPAAMAGLREAGFASVINLRLASESGADVEACRAAAEEAGLIYIHLPFDAEKPDPHLVENFLTAVGDPAKQPVYIHCNSANRVGALWMIERVLKDNWTIDNARREATKVGLTAPEADAFAINYIEAHRS